MVTTKLYAQVERTQWSYNQEKTERQVKLEANFLSKKKKKKKCNPSIISLEES